MAAYQERVLDLFKVIGAEGSGSIEWSDFQSIIRQRDRAEGEDVRGSPQGLLDKNRPRP